MAAPTWDSISQYFPIGRPIEISSNEEGFRGSWYRGSLIQPPRKRSTKVVVEYSTLTVDGRRPLREALELGLIRPAPLPEKRLVFAQNEKVDAYTRDGWWEGVIMEVKGDEYTVFFRWTWEEEVFKAPMLRPHRDWRNGKWSPPPPPSIDEVSRVDDLVFSIC